MQAIILNVTFIKVIIFIFCQYYCCLSVPYMQYYSINIPLHVTKTVIASIFTYNNVNIKYIMYNMLLLTDIFSIYTHWNTKWVVQSWEKWQLYSRNNNHYKSRVYKFIFNTIYVLLKLMFIMCITLYMVMVQSLSLV